MCRWRPSTSHTHDELHVLADALNFISADCAQRVASKESERSGDDQVATETVPAKTAEEERPKVFNCLDSGKKSARDARNDDAASPDLGAIGDADRPPGGDDVIAVEKRLGDSQQRSGFDDRVRVDRADELTRCEVERAVQRISLAAILLVDDDEARIETRAIEAPHLFCRQETSIHQIDRAQFELTRERIECCVARSVVHHHDLEIGILEGHERPHALTDGQSLVVGGYEDAHSREN